MIKTFILDTDILNDKELFHRYMRVMPEARKDKVNKCAFQSNKNLTLGAGIVLAKALTSTLHERNYKESISFSDVIFRYGEKGKPYFVQFPDLYFNLSHSGHYAVCSIGDSEVGVDIEGGHEADLKIAKRFFTPDEYEWITSVSSEVEQCKRFFRTWSLKESFLKVTGMGLSLGLDKFSFMIQDSAAGFDAVSVRYKDWGGQYHFKEFRLGEFCISVCSTDRGICDKLDYIDISE